MNKFGGFFARRAGLYDKPADPTLNANTPTDNPLELDEELFTALGAQLGGENESLRNLLLDANAKIGELDGIKNAVGKLVDPVSKALRAFEAEKSEKLSLQTVLNSTRTAYGKLRNEVAELEKKASGTTSAIGIGGMVTKLQAARKAALFGVPTILANGTVAGNLEKILRGEEVGTLFTSAVTKLTSRKHWIAFTLPK